MTAQEVRPQAKPPRRPAALVQRGLVYLGAAFAVVVLAGIVGYICVMGIPQLKPSLFEWEYN